MAIVLKNLIYFGELLGSNGSWKVQCGDAGVLVVNDRRNSGFYRARQQWNVVLHFVLINFFI